MKDSPEEEADALRMALKSKRLVNRQIRAYKPDTTKTNACDKIKKGIHWINKDIKVFGILNSNLKKNEENNATTDKKISIDELDKHNKSWLMEYMVQ